MSLQRQAQVGGRILIGMVLVAVLVSVAMVNQIRMGGPLEIRKQQMSDLLADILPPPEYIIEPWLEVTLIAVHEGSASQHLSNIGRLEQEYRERRDYWAESDLAPETKSQLAVSQQSADKFWNIVDKELIPAVHSGNDGAIRQAYGELGEVYKEHRGAIDKLVAQSGQQAEALQQHSRTISMVSIGILFLVVLLLFALIRLAMAFMDKRILKPLLAASGLMERMARGDFQVTIDNADREDEIGVMGRAMTVFRDAGLEKAKSQAIQDHVVTKLAGGLEQLSNGDLTCAIPEPFEGKYERLRQSFNEAVARLDESLTRVLEAADSVQTSSQEIRSATDDLAGRTEHQASSLEETSAAMRNVTASVSESARGADEMRVTVGSAHSDANDGGAVVAKAIAAMGAIEQSSLEIGSIVEVIDGIAFQTNLLALNAGVEAARAGDTGKGFAVVANEVRALAQRSADAAQNIKELITTSSEHVAQGVNLVGETGDVLDRIVQKISDINTLIADLANSASSQATSLQRVNSTVGEMDTMTQQNAAMVEQSTAAARSLANEAAELTSLVGRFKLSSARGGHPVVRRHEPLAKALPGAIRPMASALPPSPVHGNAALRIEDQEWAEF